jgi:hypothetical protein
LAVIGGWRSSAVGGDRRFRLRFQICGICVTRPGVPWVCGFKTSGEFMETYNYQLLRYVPDTVKDEFINIGVVLVDDQGGVLGTRMAGEDDLRRVRCLHPAADLELLRSFQSQLESEPDTASRLAWMVETGSQSLRLEPRSGCQAEDAAAALQSLYETLVQSPPRVSIGMRRGTGAWVKREADSVFRTERLLEHLESGIWAQRFTYPGDPFRIHYGYQNGAPHYIHMLSLQHSVQQAKVLAFTFERIRLQSEARLTAVVEDSAPEVPTVRFTRQLLGESRIEVLPLDRIQGLVRQVKQELRLN